MFLPECAELLNNIREICIVQKEWRLVDRGILIRGAHPSANDEEIPERSAGYVKNGNIPAALLFEPGNELRCRQQYGLIAAEQFMGFRCHRQAAGLSRSDIDNLGVLGSHHVKFFFG
jgi:hypothetical protein